MLWTERGLAWRVGAALGVTLLYVGGFTAVYGRFGAGSAALEALPVSVVAGMGGPRWGALAGVLAFGLDILLLNLVGYGQGIGVVVAGGGLVPSLAIVFIGVIVGWVAQQSDRVRRQARELEAERQRLEQEVARRQRAENLLRTSEDRLRTVVENAPVMIISIDARGLITGCEGQVKRLFGTSAERIVGTSIDSAFLSHPILLRLARDAMVGHGGTAVLPMVHRELDAHFVPVRDDTGAVTGASGVMIDRVARLSSA